MSQTVSRTLHRDLSAFTNCVINEPDSESAEHQALELMDYHGITQDMLIAEMYARLLTIARFCQCRHDHGAKRTRRKRRQH